MAVTKNAGRQKAIVSYVDIALADLMGGTTDASDSIGHAELTSAADFTTRIALPVGAVIMGGTVYVDEAFDSGTSDTLTVGDDSADDRYLSAADLQDATPKSLVPTGFIGTSAEPALVVNWTKVGAAPTHGTIRIELTYYVVSDVVTKTVNVSYAALTSGVAYDTGLALPVGAVVIAGSVAITTAFDSVTSDVVVVGDATVANRYVASTDIHTGAATPIPFVPTGFVVTGSQPTLKLTWTQVGGSTAHGALAISVSYYLASDRPVMELPQGSQILSGAIDVLEAFDSGTSDTMGLGDAASPARYKGQTSVATTGRLSLVPTGYKPTSHEELTLRWIRLGSTAPTTGKVRVQVRYFRDERADFSQD